MDFYYDWMICITRKLGDSMNWQATLWRLGKGIACCGSNTLKLNQGQYYILRDVCYNSSQPKKCPWVKMWLKAFEYGYHVLSYQNLSVPYTTTLKALSAIMSTKKEILDKLILKWITLSFKSKSESLLLHQTVRLFFLCTPHYLVCFGFQESKANLTFSYNPSEIVFLPLFCLTPVIF